MRVVFGALAEVGEDRIVVDVVEVLEVVVAVTHAAVGEASLPDWEFRFELVGEAAFDELDGSFEGDLLWRKEGGCGRA